MKTPKILAAAAATLCIVVATAIAAEKSAKKMTCCQEANAQGKECAHKCCVAARNKKQSCIKCNPGKEDLNLKKTQKTVK